MVYFIIFYDLGYPVKILLLNKIGPPISSVVYMSYTVKRSIF